VQSYNTILSLHWFCQSELFKFILCLDYLWVDMDSEWRKRQAIWRVVVRSVDVIKQSSHNGRTHRLGYASSPQSSECNLTACCSDHNVPSPTNDMSDGWILSRETVIGNSLGDGRFGIRRKRNSDRKIVDFELRFKSGKELYTWIRAFHVSTRLRSGL
jgi:hypothetical protein